MSHYDDSQSLSYSQNYKDTPDEKSCHAYEIQTAGESQYQDHPPSNPFASPPPAAAPPPPPPSESDANSVRSVTFTSDDESSSSSPGRTYETPPRDSRHDNVYSSYQNPRAAAVPMITNYGISPAQTFFPKGVSSKKEAPTPDRYMRGDTTVRPNTGQTNDEIGGLGSLREITSRLRWFTIACALSALVWEGFAFPERLLLHMWDQPAKVVLGSYLAFFCLLLLGVELNAPLRDSFGILYHPLGRGFLLLLLSTMAYAISIAWWEIVLCFAFAACSSGYTYAYVKYPEYRRWQDYNDNKIWSDMRQMMIQQNIYGDSESLYWTDPGTRGGQRARDRNWVTTQRETQALLHQV